MNIYWDVKVVRVPGDRKAVHVRIDLRDISIRGSVKVVIVRGKLNMRMIVEIHSNDVIVLSVEVDANVVG